MSLQKKQSVQALLLRNYATLRSVHEVHTSRVFSQNELRKGKTQAGQIAATGHLSATQRPRKQGNSHHQKTCESHQTETTTERINSWENVVTKTKVIKAKSGLIRVQRVSMPEALQDFDTTLAQRSWKHTAVYSSGLLNVAFGTRKSRRSLQKTMLIRLHT